MPGDPSNVWEDRIRTIAANLLTLEVNTVIKNGMVGQKMPEVPVALHEIVQQYNNYTSSCGVKLTQSILAAASGRLSDPDHSLAYFQYLRSWADNPTRYPDWPLAGQAIPQDQMAEMLTNGAETFEALVWVAIAARKKALDLELASDILPAQRLDNQRRAALLTRIEENSRQLREVALMLEQAFSSAGAGAGAAQQQRVGELQSSTQPYMARLQAVMANPAPAPAQQPARLFGGTVDQTTQALFRHPRPVLNIDPDITVLIRKAWDIGLEEVRFQTTIQVDGDVVVRVAEMLQDDRDFLAAIHRTAVDDGLKQWRMLFQVVGDLVSGLGAWLFGTKGKDVASPPGGG
jgi:hypothetical protein